MDARTGPLVLVLGLGGLAACGDGQAPSSYRGEPLMSLNGIMTSSESALGQDLVPAFVLEEPRLNAVRVSLGLGTRL